MIECERKGKLFGCRFEARYDEEPNGADVKARFADPATLREMMLTRRYVQDVCTRCGAVVKRA